MRFVVIENRSARFAENVTIKKIEDLLPGSEGTYVSFEDCAALGDEDVCDAEVVPAVAPRDDLFDARTGGTSIDESLAHPRAPGPGGVSPDQLLGSLPPVGVKRQLTEMEFPATTEE